VDWKGWPNSLATSFTRYHSPRLLSWSYVKDIVYRTKVRDITNLKQRITDAIATIDEGMLQRTWQEIEYRLDVLRATNGAHIEVY
jgi:hypothetical protein